ncbi:MULTISPECIES: hypothetical protein [unclassified Pseudoalteromonas]|uniref:hypothetical protein n=1 Tax=unclassified Pseudoalteromonas TaxID=194690 RepID=UPI0016002FB7|nr:MULTISPECIES: hypothetical protein [unclassified Pseudoalteromonas]MBB1350863.1 hypothetical protein [Pseudoalteromonas sp. SG45-3]MBB1359130.1 hypothetical protein [Pseudoalteromonas sp. SG45-6]MBB1453977.1 hypothetical protein [Pseudoalteromonas sp. SG43-5]
MSHNYKMTRAYNEQNWITSIDDVQRGLKCNCTCVDCGAQLIAKKGAIQANHFAHAPDDQKAKHCKWSYETELHLLAKEVLNNNKKLTIPIGNFDPYSFTLIFDNVDIETPIDNSRRIPDVIGYSKGEQILIEIAVSHFCGTDKISEYKRLNKNAIEFDFSNFIPTSEVITLDEVNDLFENSNAKWLSIAPAGFIGELCHAHERQSIKDLMFERREFLNKYEQEKRSLYSAVTFLKEQLRDLSYTKNNLEVIVKKDESKIRNTYRIKYKRLVENIKYATEELFQVNQNISERSNIKNEIDAYEIRLRNELNVKNQDLINKQKKLLEDIKSLELAKKFKIEQSKKEVYDFVEKQKVFLISNFNESLQNQVSELSLTKLEIRSEIIQLYKKRDELQNIVSEKQDIIDSISAQKDDLNNEKIRLELLKLEVQKQNRQYQTAAKNIERITPDLRELTRKGGIPWPFTHNLIEELSKDLKS